METTVAITKRWQIHIPKAARKAIKLNKPGMMKIKAEKNKLILVPSESKILKLAGKFSKYARAKKVDIDKIRDFIDYSGA